MLLPSMSPYLLLVKIGSSPRLRLTLNSFTSKLRDALVVISTSVVSTTEKRISPVSSESNGFSSFVQAANDNSPIRERMYRICLCIVIISYIIYVKYELWTKDLHLYTSYLILFHKHLERMYSSQIVNNFSHYYRYLAYRYTEI